MKATYDKKPEWADQLLTAKEERLKLLMQYDESEKKFQAALRAAGEEFIFSHYGVKIGSEVKIDNISFVIEKAIAWLDVNGDQYEVTCSVYARRISQQDIISPAESWPSIIDLEGAHVLQ